MDAERSARGAAAERPQEAKVTCAGAQEALQRWLSSHALAPSNKRDVSVKPRTLPFWLFELDATIEYSGALGFDRKQHISWSAPTAWRRRRPLSLSPADPLAQVYASCRLRRDFASAAAGSNASHILGIRSSSSSQQSDNEAETGSEPSTCPLSHSLSPDAPSCDGIYSLPNRIYPTASPPPPWPEPPTEGQRSRKKACLHEPFEMRRSIALEQTMRAVRQCERQRAKRELKHDFNADHVADVLVRAFVKRVRAHAVRLPAYSLEYEHGKILTFSQQIVPERFMAVVSGVNAQVSAERLVSQNKARAAAAAGTAASALVTYPIVLPPDTLHHFIDWAFAGMLATSVAGLVAEAVPREAHRRSQEQRVEHQDAELKKLWSKASSNKRASEPLGKLKDDVEWLRWQEQDRRDWHHNQRYAWGHNLWQSQHQRRRQRQQFREAQEKAKRRDEKSRRRAAVQRESRKQKFRDRSGYYRLLRLQGHEQNATHEEIKEAYRQQVMRMHPDKQLTVSKDEAERQFHQLHSAYEVLSDPQLRQQYHAAEEEGAAP